MTAWPPVGLIRFGSLRRTEPISRHYGFDRGQPIDRFYIDRFLEGETRALGEQNPVAGAVLEVGEDRYSHRFATPGAIAHLDIVDIAHDNPAATVIADLTDDTGLKSEAYDCVICTQTLLLIFDVAAAVRTLHRILRPGGTLLVTVPGISQVCQPEMTTTGDFWRFTTRSMERLLAERFPENETVVESFGNVQTASAFLFGLAAEDISPSTLATNDPDYQLVIGARSVKR